MVKEKKMKRRDYVPREIALEERNDETISKIFDGEIPAEKEPNGTPETKTGVVDGALYVRLRWQPNTSEENMRDLLPKGTKLEILGEASHFYKVRLFNSPRTTGYASKAYIKIIE